MDTGFLTINGEKMSKSLGNYVTVRDALEKYDAEAIRLFVLSTHYRNEIDFTDKKLKDAEANLKRLINTLEAMEEAMEVSVKRELSEGEKAFEGRVEKLRGEFVEAMDEDFSTPRALAALFDLSKEINRFLDEQGKVSRKLLEKVYGDFSELGKVLGLFQREKTREIGEKIIDDLVKLLFDLREELRKKGDYGLSDTIRARMKEAGLVIEDTAEGPKWKLS